VDFSRGGESSWVLSTTVRYAIICGPHLGSYRSERCQEYGQPGQAIKNGDLKGHLRV